VIILVDEEEAIQATITTSRAPGFRDAMERGAAAVFLAAASPVIAASAGIVSMLSGRSPFIAHQRVGEGGETLWVWKLRTMWTPQLPEPREQGWVEYIVADPPRGAKNPDDGRVTSQFARFVRRHSIDELPQLWQVARGEMSLVGPRPLTRTEVIRYYGARADELLSVKPGITGIWQTRGRSAIKFPERAAMDLELVGNLNARTYFAILLRTVPALFHGKGAW
jgi:lipopolysaccharide/colanic/teichoic acid biosynthesis glycosyltransferase